MRLFQSPVLGFVIGEISAFTGEQHAFFEAGSDEVDELRHGSIRPWKRVFQHVVKHRRIRGGHVEKESIPCAVIHQLDGILAERVHEGYGLHHLAIPQRLSDRQWMAPW